MAYDEGWTGERVARWLRQSAGLERQLAPVSEVLFAAARLQPGDAVLDVGCGAGPTTRQAAVAVGPGGRVTGLDLAGEMLAGAAAVVVPAGAAPIEWLEADVATWRPSGPDYDVVLSRFGVMFFADPATAFAALAAATRPGGRLALATWTRRDRSPLFGVPFRAALEVLADRGVPVEELADDAGPFSLHGPEILVPLLTDAGWAEVAVEGHDLLLPFAGGLVPADAAEACLDFGPTRTVTAGLPDDQRAAVATGIASAMADHIDDAGHVVLGGRVLVTTARR